MNNAPQIILYAKNITKKFPGVIALKNVNFDLNEGEIHAIVGQNGAGKTTFLRIINGILQPDEGEIYIQGRKVLLRNPLDAKRLGIVLVHQEATLLPNLSIAENIFIDTEMPFKKFTVVKRDQLIDEVRKYLEYVGIKRDPSTKVKELRAAERQLVQIARIIAEEGTKIICMDEPTSALTRGEIIHLFDLMRDLKRRGKSIIFVTHKIEEVFEIADRVTVLREGTKIATLFTNETSPKELVRLMIGKSIEDIYVYREERESIKQEVPILSVKHLYTIPLAPTETALKDISFDLFKGEILGITGLLGSGKTELGKTLIGMGKIIRGEIYLYGRKVKIHNPSHARKLGIVYLPEDRLKEGLILNMTIRDNIVLPSITKLSIFRVVRRLALERKIAIKYIDMLNIIPSSPMVRVDALSGGNKQKVVIAKFIETSPRVFIFDEPTFGIDIGAKAEVRRLITMLADKGHGILLLSSDIDEVLSLSDRILILKDGMMMGIYHKKELNREKLIEILGGAYK